MTIKLVAADMDGTLLDDDKRLSPRLFPMIRRLNRLGVQFVVSSGRQYFNLRKLFAPVADDIAYCCENGSIIFCGSRNIHADVISPDGLIYLIDFLSPHPQLHTVLCGVDGCFFMPCPEAVEKEIRCYYEVCSIVPELKAAVSMDRICKVAVYDERDAESDFFPEFRRLRRGFLGNLSGRHWLDIMNEGCDKGTAVRILQDNLAVRPEECMAFGDYLNDCGMLDNCFYSYAMGNAHPGLLRHARFRAPDNNHDGVCAVLEQFFGR